MIASAWFRPIAAMAVVIALAGIALMSGRLPRTESLASSQGHYSAGPRTLATEMLLGGTLQPARSAVLYPENAGVVTELAVARGDLVAAADVILIVRSLAAESERAQAQLVLRHAELMLERARAALNEEPLDYARRNHATQRSLFAEGLVAKGDVDLAEHEVRSAEQTYRLTRLDIEVAETALLRARAAADATERTAASFRVRSPIAGRVVQLNVNVGDSVSPRDGSRDGVIPVEVAAERGLVFRAAASAGQTQRLRVGQPARVVVSGAQASYAGHVSHIPRVGEKSESGTVTFGVEILLPDVSLDDVLLNAPASAEIVSEAEVAVAIPIHCVDFDGLGNAFVTVGGVAPHRRPIRAGRTGSNWLEVVDGLSAGEAVSSCAAE